MCSSRRQQTPRLAGPPPAEAVSCVVARVSMPQPLTHALALLLLHGSANAGKPPGDRQLLALRQRVSVDAHADTRETPTTDDTREAVFAAGCFWGVELAFARLPGVVRTEVGYVGGHTKAPTYRQVSRGDTMHAEAVRIQYDARETTYETLLGVLFDIHDPTTKNRQGNDVGTQYRSAIFYADEWERTAALSAIKNEENRLGKKLATTVEPLADFTTAEEYHQAYLVKGGQTDSKGAEDPIRCYG